MKSTRYLAVLLLLPAIAWAQDRTTATTLWEQVLPVAITIVVPLLIALSRTLIPLIPGWLLPILSPILGAVLSLIVDATAGQNTGIIMGAVYGGLGSWLRDLITHIQSAIGTTKEA